jgi:7-dehydrocholesterol reductase
VPGFYTTTSLYLVKHSPVHQFGVILFIFILSVGILVIALNYSADIQKQIARDSNGKCNIWGKPAKVIRYKKINREYSPKKPLFNP